MTVNTKQDAIRCIEQLVEKARSIMFSAGIYASDGYRKFHEEAKSWDGTGEVPRRMAQLSGYMELTPIHARDYVLTKNQEIDDVFFDTDAVKFAAKKEIYSLLDDFTQEQINTLVDKYRVIFEVMITNANL